MPFWFTLVMMILFSAVPAASAWAFAQRRPQAVRFIIAIAAGMAPLSILGWMVYRSEGGNGDLDPLQFFYLMVAVSFAGALTGALAMEWRLRHR